MAGLRGERRLQGGVCAGHCGRWGCSAGVGGGQGWLSPPSPGAAPPWPAPGGPRRGMGVGGGGGEVQGERNLGQHGETEGEARREGARGRRQRRCGRRAGWCERVRVSR